MFRERWHRLLTMNCAYSPSDADWEESDSREETWRYPARALGRTLSWQSAGLGPGSCRGSGQLSAAG